MSLHDTDPNTTNRAEPMPQSSDQNPVRVSDGTTAITNKQDASSGPYVSTNNGAVKVNNGTNMIGLFGPDSTGQTVIKIAKPGFDASTATDEQLVFNSSQNTFKIVGTGTLTAVGPTVSIAAVGVDVQSASTNIAHGLGFAPAVIAYAFDGLYYQFVPAKMGQNNTANYTAFDTVNVYSDATNVRITVRTELYNFVAGARTYGPASYDIKYYLLQETAN